MAGEFYILLEDGGKIMLEDDSGGALLLEDGLANVWVEQPESQGNWTTQ